jgi:hypothetical protein
MRHEADRIIAKAGNEKYRQEYDRIFDKCNSKEQTEKQDHPLTIEEYKAIEKSMIKNPYTGRFNLP